MESDEEDGEGTDIAYQPKKQKTTKWKRLEVKRLEEEAGEMEADVELAVEELPVAVAELHEKAEKSKDEADINASNAVTKIYAALKKPLSAESKKIVGLFIQKCAEVRAA